MSQSELSMQSTPTESPTERRNSRHVLACVHGASFAEAVLTHAAAVANTLGARMTVIHVLASSAAKEPMDPVEWTERHCLTNTYLHERLSHFKGSSHLRV